MIFIFFYFSISLFQLQQRKLNEQRKRDFDAFLNRRTKFQWATKRDAKI